MRQPSPTTTSVCQNVRCGKEFGHLIRIKRMFCSKGCQATMKRKKEKQPVNSNKLITEVKYNNYRIVGNRIIRLTDRLKNNNVWDGDTLPEFISCSLPHA